ncbi:MAG: hypothetical protein NT154_45070 [Verrucomicrobia bacterium]|nr:hypothetical protein [Verrucomicrobiota bacterium]
MKRFQTSLLAAAILAAIALPSRAASITWTNTSGGSWSAAANWSPNIVPGPSDDVLIGTAGTYSVTLDASPTVNSLTLGGAGGWQTLATSGNTLTLNGASVVNTNGILSLNSGSLGGSSGLTVSGQFNWTGGTLLSGALLTIASNGVMNLSGSGDKHIAGGTLNNAGSVAWTGGNILGRNWFAINVISNQAGALFDVQTEASLSSYDCCGSSALTIYNAGTFRKSAGTGTNAINWDFNNTGLVDVQSGGLSLNSGGTGSGTLTVASGAPFGYNNSITLLGPITGAAMVESGSTLALNGPLNLPAVTVSGATLLLNGSFSLGSVGVSGGLLAVNGAATVENLGLSGGTFSGADASLGLLSWTGGALGGTNTVSGTNTWTGGTLNSGAVLTVASNGVLNLSGSGDKYIAGGTLNNAGSVTWTGGNVLGADCCGPLVNVISNQAGALFDVQTDASLSRYNYGGWGAFTIYNAGTFRKSAGTGTNAINWALNNTGLVDVQSGAVNFQSSYTQTAGGTKLNGGNIATSSTLSMQGGSLSGSGTINGNVYNAGEMNPGSSFGIITVNGNYTHAGRLNIDLGGLTAGSQFDQLVVTGQANLAGRMSVLLKNGYLPNVGDSFQVFRWCRGAHSTEVPAASLVLI